MNLPNSASLHVPNLLIIPPKLKLAMYFTKSPKHNNIYELYLWMPEKHVAKC